MQLRAETDDLDEQHALDHLIALRQADQSFACHPDKVYKSTKHYPAAPSHSTFRILDHEVVASTEPTQSQSRFDPKWVSKVIEKRASMHAHLKSTTASRQIADSEILYELISSGSPVLDELLAGVTEVCLQDMFSYEYDLQSEQQVRWLWGLLCLMEKPLLPDVQSDLLLLLKDLLAVAPKPETNLLIALIEEHFN